MLIGVFYSVLGLKLLSILSSTDPNIKSLEQRLIPNSEWPNKKFSELTNTLQKMTFDVDMTKIDLVELKQVLVSQGDFLTRLLENPTLFEHETFTELLRAVFHLDEELRSRKNIKTLSEKDAQHIINDIKRAYNLLVYEWLDYIWVNEADDYENKCVKIVHFLEEFEL